MKFSLNALNESLANARKYKNLIVGFSGGLDSSVLLHGVLALAKKVCFNRRLKQCMSITGRIQLAKIGNYSVIKSALNMVFI